MTRSIAVIKRTRLPVGPSVFGPILLPDDATSFSLLFPVTDEHVGWCLDTFLSFDYGLTWSYAGGMARMWRGARRNPVVVHSGMKSCLSSGTHRLLRAELTLSKPLVMSGILSVSKDGRLLGQTVLEEHHSVAFDAVGGNNTVFAATSATTAAFTVGGTNRAGLLGLWMGDVTATSLAGTLATITASAVSGADTGSVQLSERALLFQAVGLATGSQTGSMSWSTSMNAALDVVTASGVDQTLSVNNGAFNTTPTLQTTCALSVTSNPGDMTCTVSGTSSGVQATTSQTIRTPTTEGAVRIDTAPGSSSNTHTWTTLVNDSIVVAGANFVQDTSMLASPSSQLSESGGMVGRRWR